MKRILTILFTVVLFAGPALAIDPPSGPITVTNFGSKEPVVYKHSIHLEQGLQCKQCHHKADEGFYKCGDCHTDVAEGDKPKLKDAMHEKGIGKCYDCHRAKEAKNRKKCKECHKKQ